MVVRRSNALRPVSSKGLNIAPPRQHHALEVEAVVLRESDVHISPDLFVSKYSSSLPRSTTTVLTEIGAL
jgi:hypothetical protein